MKYLNVTLLLFLSIFVTPVVAETIDKSSDAYKAGQYVGYAFGAVLLFIIIKKFLDK